MSTARRHFGSIRKLPSGRYQATYRVRGEEHKARNTFVTKTEAQAFLAGVESDLHRGDRVNPKGGRLTLKEYST